MDLMQQNETAVPSAPTAAVNPIAGETRVVLPVSATHHTRLISIQNAPTSISVMDPTQLTIDGTLSTIQTQNRDDFQALNDTDINQITNYYYSKYKTKKRRKSSVNKEMQNYVQGGQDKREDVLHKYTGADGSAQKNN